MFGKRSKKLASDRGLVSNVIQNPISPDLLFSCDMDEMKHYQNHSKPVLDYILTQATENECPFIKVKLYDFDCMGLLDSGADKVYINQSLFERLLKNGAKFNQLRSKCTVASDSTVECIGYVSVPIKLQHKLKVFDIFVIPNLRHYLILGALFWIKMGIVPDLRKGEWHFSEPGYQEINNLSVIQTADDLTYEQREQLNAVVENYFNQIKDIKLGCTDLVTHTIVTNSPPIKSRYYPVSNFLQKKIDEEVTKMLELGVIERSNSGWSSPVLMVPKSNNEYRLCIDYRKLNSVTEKCAYPLPYMNSILDRLGNARYLTSLDIKSAYWQIKMSEQSKRYTAFTVPGRGLFHFNRMPFGLTNAPATFQALVDKIFGPELEPYLFKYLDDLIIVTPDFDTHIKVLSETFDRLLKAGLTLNRDKCQFCRDELKYIGYVVNRSGLSVDPEKVSAIVNMPIPKTPRQVRSVLGMVSFYRRFIPHLSTIISPLTALTKKHVKFKWTPECEKAFQEVKNALVSAPILDRPNFEVPFVLQCDASSYGLGCVLTQEVNGREHVICYLSRSLTKNELKFSVTEKELLAVLWACEKLRCYIEGTKFTVVTDHHSLIWLNNLKNPQGRLGRWALKLQQYDMEIVHRPGKHHLVPDCLSRAIEHGTINIVQNESDPWYDKMCQAVLNDPLSYPNWRVDGNILFKYVKHNSFSNNSDNWKMVVPKPKRCQILKECHDNPLSGHLGIYKTYYRVLSRYFWPKLKADVAKFVNKCRTCAEQKTEQAMKPGQMGSKPDVDRCWQYIAVDLMGPCPRSIHGHRFILVVCDYFSKFVLSFPLRQATAKAVVRLIEEQVFLIFGVPEFLRSDNGVQFKSKEFIKLLEEYNVKHLTTPLYHPEPNFVERANRTIKTMISSYIGDNQKHWDTNLSKLTCAYRTAKNEVIQNTPYSVNFGCEMITSGKQYKENRLRDNCQPDSPDLQAHEHDELEKLRKLRKFVKHKLEEAHLKTSHDYNLRHRPVQFQPGDFVWKREYSLSDAAQGYSAKLGKKFTGPYRVRKKLGVNTYELVDDTGKSKGHWHVKDLKIDKTQCDD